MKESGMKNMALEPENVEKILDEHSKALEEHSEKITELQLKNERFDEKLNSIQIQMSDVKDAVTKFESNYLQTSNSMISTMSQIVMNTSSNNTQIVTTKENNRTQLILKILTIGGGILILFILAWFAMKGINLTFPVL